MSHEYNHTVLFARYGYVLRKLSLNAIITHSQPPSTAQHIAAEHQQTDHMVTQLKTLIN